ncbi:MAG: restriction endonuclease subunit S [Gaiellaceae bacterium]
MASEWNETPIGELAEIFDGPHATPKKIEEGPVFLGISNLAQGRLDLSNAEHLSEEDFKRWTRRVTPSLGDVVFSYETRLGEAALIPSGLRCCLGRRMGLLRPKPGKVDARFLLYAYLGPQFQETLRARTVHGSTVDRVPLIDLPEFPIRVPDDVGEQRAIAHILGTLDDKIELNRRMNETLEQIVRALFRSWFVDFDPVRVKAEGRDPGLPSEIADLFPDSFEESELGEIPKGWRVAKLGDLLELPYGKALRADNRTAGRIPVFGSNGQIGWHAEKLAEGPGIVVGRKGNPGVVTWAPTDFFAIDTTFYVLPKTGCRSLHFLFYALSDHDLAALSADSAVPGLNRGLAYMSKQVVPSDRVLEAFDRKVRPLFERIHHGNEISTTLAASRDALLPKLISGELRTAGARLIVPEAR